MKRILTLLAIIAAAWMPARANTLSVLTTSPTSGSTGVGLHTTITFTFNRAVDLYEITDAIVAEPEGLAVIEAITQSQDGREVRIAVMHVPDTDYTWIVSGAYTDPATNVVYPIDAHVLRYTTAATRGNTTVAGTISMLSGAGGNEDVTNSVVILSTLNPLESEDAPPAGAAVVNGISGMFEIPYVRPGTYFPYAVKVGMGDGPLGDWFGSMYFGFYDANGDGIPDAVTVPASGLVADIDFTIAPLSHYAGTAAEMEDAARLAAADFAHDQKLVGISTFMLGQVGSSAAWTYNFYSPSTEMQTDVTVTPFSVEAYEEEYAGSESPATLPLTYADSDRALLTGLLNGGQVFLQEHDATIIGLAAGIALESDLGAGPGTEGPYWAVTFMSFLLTKMDYLVVYVDFETGDFISREYSTPRAGRYSDVFPNAIAEVASVEGNFILIGMRGEGLAEDGVAETWEFDFYAQNTDTRAVVTFFDGGSLLESETNVGHPQLMTLGGVIIDSDVAIASAMSGGGALFVAEHGLSAISVRAGDLSDLYAWATENAAYLVTIYGAGGEEVWFRAVLDPNTAMLLFSENNQGSEVEPGGELPNGIALGENYPNPFNPQTTIPFEVAAAGQARLVVYDLLGREVAVLVDGHVPTGAQQVQWDASDVPSGVYLYRLTQDGKAQSRKLVLQK